MKRKIAQKIILIGLVTMGLSNCTNVGTYKQDDVNAEHQLILNQSIFDQCHVAAMNKSELAINGASPALYHIAAVAMQNCLAEVSETVEITHSKKALQAAAIVVINYKKILVPRLNIASVAAIVSITVTRIVLPAPGRCASPRRCLWCLPISIRS